MTSSCLVVRSNRKIVEDFLRKFSKMKETEKLKVAYKHITGDLSQNMFKKKQFHQALALVGKNVPRETVSEVWTPYMKGGMSYAEFCETCTVKGRNLVEKRI